MKELTPEQQVVADRWQRNQEECKRIWDEAMARAERGEDVDWSQAALDLDKVIPTFCEHGHVYTSSCLACDEIEKILFPDNFSQEELDE